MILPTTYFSALLLTLLAMICWGSWANTTKLTGKWRFELFYFDFAIGVLLTAAILAYTLGELGSELTFRDNLLITGRRQMLYAFVAGGLFNFSNMLLVAAISVAGMAVAFPIGAGFAFLIAAMWSYILHDLDNSILLFAGAAILIAGIIAIIRAHRLDTALKDAQAAKEWKSRRRPPPKTGYLAVGLSISCGVIMGSFYPLVELSETGELGLRVYATGLIFALGVFFSTPFYSLFFMNLPVQGKPIGVVAYIRGTIRQHALGIAGGAIWMIGSTAHLAAASAPREIHLGTTTSYAIGYGAVLVGTLWGFLYWKEFKDAPPAAMRMIIVMIALFVIGLGLMAIGQ